MNKQRKQLIDRIVGFLLVILLRVPAFVLETLLRRNHDLSSAPPPQRIVVAKYIGIGSILQALPMTKSLKEAFPNADIVFLSTKQNKELLSRYDFIDVVWFVDDESIYGLLKSCALLLPRMITARIDVFIDLEVHSHFGSLMTLLSCARNRLGFSRQDTTYKAFMYTHLLYFNNGFPIRNCYLQLARLLNVRPLGSNECLPFPNVRTHETDNVERIIATEIGMKNKGIVALNPNASDLRFERRWGQRKFADLAQHYAMEGYQVVMLGAKNERSYVQNIVDQVTTPHNVVKNMAGIFSLLEFFHFLTKVDLLVTNDSGIMNIGLTMNLPLVLLSGPVDPEQYLIPRENRAYIYKKPYCSPCTHYVHTPPCGGEKYCMEAISVKEVIEVSDSLLSGGKVRSVTDRITNDGSMSVFGVLRDRSGT